MRNNGANGIIPSAGNDGGYIILLFTLNTQAFLFNAVAFLLAAFAQQCFIAFQHFDGLKTGNAHAFAYVLHSFFHRGYVLKRGRGGGGVCQYVLEQVADAGLVQRADFYHRAA